MVGIKSYLNVCIEIYKDPFQAHKTFKVYIGTTVLLCYLFID